MENGRQIFSPVIERGKVQRFKKLAVLKYGNEVVADISLGALMPADQFEAAQTGPLGEEVLESRGRSGVNSEGDYRREGDLEAVGEKVRIGRGRGE